MAVTLCPTTHSFLQAPRRSFVGQVGNLRPIVNRPAGIEYNASGNAGAICSLPLCGAANPGCSRLVGGFLRRARTVPVRSSQCQ
jgi:hypothetical protein